MTVYGYARVSTDEQDLDLQLDALTAFGCERIFKDEGVSAIAERREEFEELLATVQAGDTVVVWKNDRAHRRLTDACMTMQLFTGLGVKYVSITEFLDTS